jgi:hypothetical protein
MDYDWTCACCGKRFQTLPLDYAFKSPDHWHGLPEEERVRRGYCSSDFCEIDGTDLFIRGCIDVPIRGGPERFSWGAWVSLSAASMARAKELFDRDPEPGEAPRFGWLCNCISIYPDTLNLRTQVRFQPGNQRPLIVLEPTDHPLAVEQREGITLDRVKEIVAALMHRD